MNPVGLIWCLFAKSDRLLVQRKSRNCRTILQWIIQPFLTQYCWAMADATRKKFRPLDQGKIGMQDFGNKIYLVLVAS